MSMNRSCENGYYMRGSPLLHSLYDVLLLALYILTCSLLCYLSE